MNKATIFKSPIIPVLIPLLLMMSLVFLLKSSLFATNPSSWSTLVTLDFILTIPVIYFLLIRKKEIPKITVVSVFIIGLVIASFTIPKENQVLLNLVKTWVLPVVEIGILSLVSYKVYIAITHFKKNKGIALDFYTVLKNTCYEILPKKAAIFLATEIAVFYYGFIHWKKIELKENEFTYHKNTGTQVTLVAIIFLIVIETAVFHILIAKSSITVAWILTILSIYSGFQILGFLRSLSKRPIAISKDMLKLRYGILSEVDIDIQDIESVELTTKPLELLENVKYLSFLGDIEGHNILINLKKENTLIGFYGIKKKFKTIALHLDEKAAFMKQLESKF